MNSVKYVPGEGPKPCKIVFIGESPRETEDRLGRPFVGRSGKLLDNMIAQLGLKREEVYVTNIVKVRPNDNRPPTEEELDSWKEVLLTELDEVEPMVIVTLGNSATQALARPRYKGKPISELRGKVICEEPYIHIATYHPSYLLRQPSAKELVKKDLEKVKFFIED